MRLGQNAQALCQLTRAAAPDVFVEAEHLARVGRALRNRVDDRAFTRAVGADQHEPVAFLQREAYLVQYGQRAVANA